MFRVNSGHGFHIEFPNGVVLSTQIGTGNYCDNYDKEIGNFPKIHCSEKYHSIGSCESSTAEIAIWDTTQSETREFFDKKRTGNKWITKEMIKTIFPEQDYEDDVKGRVTMDEWLKIFEWCKNYKLTNPTQG